MSQSIEYPFYEPEKRKSTVRSIGPPEDWKPEGFEKNLYGKHHNLWAMMKVAEEIIPFGKTLTESGRAELGAMKGSELGTYLGIESAVVALPFVGKYVSRWVGTGLRSAYLKARPSRQPVQLELLDKIRPELNFPRFPDPSEILARKYHLSEAEIVAYQSKDLGWFFVRSGGVPSEGLKKIFDLEGFKKTGKAKFVRSVQEELKAASKPIRVQEFEWLKKEWDAKVSQTMNIPQTLNDENRNRIIKYMGKQFFGEDVAKGLTLETMTPEYYANLLKLLMDPANKATIASVSRAGAGTFLPTMIQPARVIFGSGDELFGTNKIYKVGKEAYETFRASTFVAVTKLNQILHSKGLGKIKRTATGEARFKLDKAFRESYYKAGPAIKQLEDLIHGRAKKSELDAFYGSIDDTTRKFVDTYFQWKDQQYLAYFRAKLHQIVDESQVTGPGRSRFYDLLDNDKDGVFKVLGEAFTPAADVSPYSKDLIVAMQRERIVRMANQLINEKHVMGDVDRMLTRLEPFLKKDNPGGLIGYLDDFVYTAAEKHARKNSLVQRELATKRVSTFFTTSSKGETITPDFALLVESRARKQGLENYFYPTMDEILDVAKASPDSYREYTGHWFFRLLGKPSPVDDKMADWLTNSYGHIERILGLPSNGLWNAERVRNVAYSINNLVYMGGLGFKPFSALRNFIQPLITVPGDLGGAKDIRWFLKGVHRATDPKFREYIIKDLKAITEYAPELHIQARATMAGQKVSLAGKEFVLPDSQQFRDTAMWMFQMSDRWNRYISGGAAASKWDHIFEKTIKAGGGLKNEEFIKKMNFKGRHGWVRDELEDLVRTGGATNLEKARGIFVKDVIADTQYLYGVTDSPIIMNRFGAPGRLATTFQSWWMNYATLLEKWMKTGDAGTKANRLFGFMLTTAISLQLMEPIWGRGTAGRTVGFGPFPGEFNEFMIPPAYAPFYHILAGMISLGKLDPDSAERHGKAFMRTTTGMMIPGGLQWQQSIRGWKDERWEGLAKSIIRYQKTTNYEPLWGLLD